MKVLAVAVTCLVGVLALIVLYGCATPAPAIKVVCVPVAPYTAAEQQRLASEIGALPHDAMLVRAMVDYGRMRAAARACHG